MAVNLSGRGTLLRLLMRVAAVVVAAHSVRFTPARAPAIRACAAAFGAHTRLRSRTRVTDKRRLRVVITPSPTAVVTARRVAATEPPALAVPPNAPLLPPNERAQQNAGAPVPPPPPRAPDRAEPPTAQRFVATALPARAPPLVPHKTGALTAP